MREDTYLLNPRFIANFKHLQARGVVVRTGQGRCGRGCHTRVRHARIRSFFIGVDQCVNNYRESSMSKRGGSS